MSSYKNYNSLEMRRRQSIEQALIDDPSTSDKAIAQAHSTSNSSVRKIRAELEYNGIIEKALQRRGADGKIYTKRASDYVTDKIGNTVCFLERDIQIQVRDYLLAKNLNVKTEVLSSVGKVDILTDTCLYEIKQVLSRDDFFHALGQAISYKQALSFQGDIAIIGGRYERGIVQLVENASSMGIKVYIWNDTDLILLLDYHQIYIND